VGKRCASPKLVLQFSALRRTDLITRSGLQTAAQKIGFDESPTGYSLASCSAPELASASPADGDSEGEMMVLRRKFIDGKCANYKLSQLRGSPHFCVPNVCQLRKSQPRCAPLRDHRLEKLVRKTHHLTRGESEKKNLARLQNLYSSVRFRSPPPKPQ
jgi:hypothetical protein